MYCLTILLLLLPTWSAGCRADVYQYTDDTGTVHYSNQAETKRYIRVAELAAESHVSAKSQSAGLRGGGRAYAAIIDTVAAEAELESALVHAVISVESGYNPAAVSRAGAQGLMQLMPGTAQRYAVKDAFDPEQNIRGGAFYLRDLLRMFDNELHLALAAYNAGERAVKRYGGKIPPYKETLAYVPKVLKRYQQIKL